MSLCKITWISLHKVKFGHSLWPLRVGFVWVFCVCAIWNNEFSEFMRSSCPTEDTQEFA